MNADDFLGWLAPHHPTQLEDLSLLNGTQASFEQFSSYPAGTALVRVSSTEINRFLVLFNCARIEAPRWWDFREIQFCYDAYSATISDESAGVEIVFDAGLVACNTNGILRLQNRTVGDRIRPPWPPT